MERLKDGILGGISGKIGDVIGYIRYGKAYVTCLESGVKGSDTRQCHSHVYAAGRVADVVQLCSAWKVDL